MVASFNLLIEHMRELRAKPTGKLRVQMLPGFAISHFGRMLADFTRRYPDIEVDVIVNDRVVDPIKEGFDVAFLIFPSMTETLIERKLFKVRRLFYMSPDYAVEFGVPAHPREPPAEEDLGPTLDQPIFMLNQCRISRAVKPCSTSQTWTV